ncbi:MAG: hypothetical protein HYU42_07700 [Candidatus Rokubacteria bacterium]|nr:hypothetical protein [Candidatus Rokubacteria bacterium]
MARSSGTTAKLVAGALALLAFLSLTPTPSRAGGSRIIVGGGTGPEVTSGGHRVHQQERTKVIVTDPRTRVIVTDPRTKVIVTDPRTRVIVTDPRTRVIVAPRTYYYAPSYVAPVYPRWMPGYWTYQWVPQMSTSYAYVPGFYTAEGVWVESHYQPKMIQTGYYQQPVWVEGYWAR